MPIDAKFTADFSDFDKAVKAASGTLKKLEGDAASTSKEVVKLADTSAKSFKSASSATQDWTKDFNQFDSILSAAGLNVGKYVKGIGELRSATSGAAEGMSGLATAGVAVGAALAAIELAKVASDFLVTNQHAQDLLITLQGLTNPKFETELAKQDTIHRAIMAGMKSSGNAAQDYANAIQYMTEKQNENLLVTGYSRTAYRDTLYMLNAWDHEIQAITDRGDLKQFTADLNDHYLSLDQLSVKYGVHKEAITYYRGELQKAKDLEAAEAKLLKEELARALETAKLKADAFAMTWKDIATQDLSWMTKAATGIQGMTDKIDAMVLKQYAVKAELEAFKSSAASLGPLEQLTAEYDKLKASLDRTGASAEEQELAYLKYQEAFMGAIPPVKTLGEESGKTGDKVRDAGNKAAGSVAGFQALGAAVNYAAGSFQNMYTQVGFAPGYEGSLRTANDMFSEYGRAGIPIHGGLIPGAPHRAAGGPVSSGSPYVVGERGPELFVPRTSGQIVPNAGGAGGVVVNVYGSTLASQQELAALVQDALMQSYRQRGNRQPV
jgi:hypothetical protein